MNMPPPKIDFLTDNFNTLSPNVRKFSFNIEPNNNLFSNHIISNGLQKFDTIRERHQLNNNFMKDDK